ncbi:hypothetical protein [Enterobacter kobei]|uniref:hypothetical protein n=1 Tax=Enterobacter kobei TaxID=208224 RepID=UPI002468193F|nr:hypothetical protein [Enterobacter kobei]
MLTDTKLRNLKPRDKLYKVNDREGLYVGVAGSQHSKKSPLTTPVFRGPQKTLRLSLRLISSYPLPIYLLVGRININNTTTQ